MTKDDEDRSLRKTPAEHEDDWKDIWQSVDHSRKLWWLIGPVHSVVSNWKLFAIVGGAIAFFSRDGIWAAIQAAIVAIYGGAP